MTPAEPLAALWRDADPARTALVCPDDGTRLTYGQLGENVLALAGALSALGVARGDRVCLALPNGPELVELVLAAAAIGRLARLGGHEP